MTDYFFYLPKLDSAYYTNYFLNEFIPKFKFTEKITNGYLQYNKSDIANETVLTSLNNYLKEEYNYPDIEYIALFKHIIDQPIHADGVQVLRHASLNLPLSGYKPTKMVFYKQTLPTTTVISDANYFDSNSVTPVVELPGSNNWVMVNSGVPHNIINVDPLHPRITVCIRFCTNPTVKSLYA